MANKTRGKEFLHFWRYVGWLMGIDEKWLIQSEPEGWRLLYWMQFAHPRSDHSSIELGLSLSKEPLRENICIYALYSRNLLIDNI